MRSPLGRVLGLGAAGEGAGHWWAQRVSAVALVPLGLWFVLSVIGFAGMSYSEALVWTQRPLNAVLLLLFVVMLFYHSYLGLQVVIEDYFHVHWVKVSSLLLLKFVYVLLAIMSLFMILRVAVGGVRP